ncbi:DUF6990 domain-containing protein [Candidatus Bartonella washoeensis]|uniref:Uncharacterized protein n=1 Tax=Cardidatus Bartonella washoeensis 085-0475 TaxID=1094564 RepID=J1JHT3_9HYPH|nr:hypothetical protein [Bartonella washoeensis]EJF83735.1 hypothetical protein MCW_01284 [Bartonella washoeensis 085-0475]
MLDETLEWTMEDSRFQEMLRSQYSTPPWEKDTVVWSTHETNRAPYVLLHLAALALLGDVETLRSYQKCFAEGNHLGVEASTEAVTLGEFHLERALLIAEEVAKTEQLSDAVLERAAEKLSIKVDNYRDFRVRDPNLCHKKRAYHREAVEWKKQKLREQGCIVCDEEVMFKAGGRKTVPILFISRMGN